VDIKGEVFDCMDDTSLTLAPCKAAKTISKCGTAIKCRRVDKTK